jgi:hypothetical protein
MAVASPRLTSVGRTSLEQIINSAVSNDFKIKLLSRSRTSLPLRYSDDPPPENSVFYWTKLVNDEIICRRWWMNEWAGSIDRMALTGETRIAWKKACSVATKIPHWPARDRSCAFAVWSPLSHGPQIRHICSVQILSVINKNVVETWKTS